MSFLKKIFKSDPKDDFRKVLSEFKWPKKAFNIYEVFEKFDKKIIDDIFNEKITQREIENGFIGSQGWFLCDLENIMNDFINKMKTDPLDLDKRAKALKLSAKRLFIALEHQAKRLKIEDPPFYRKEKILFLRTYLYQKWTDALVTIDFEEEESFKTVFKRVKIKNEHLEFVSDIIKTWLQSPSSEISLGKDGILRRKSEIEPMLDEFISNKWENKIEEITFLEVAEEFGLHIDEVTKFVTNMFENGLLKTSTIYPVDELLKPRVF